ncbi:hypothetical protein EROM_071070 [Encephalitozoon romaleae SJ-2008]|uniref:Uncharacterized protein n=1 Tax=Encephalitozoon romaleae (strain SJ-2008) TaxID=1178016 RepID=I6ZJE1_ENCRO|nr:hypothetical protein EROM_071070 [Encephalitozoon romaleae SJ-2008]AFN83358.1 hypothetical protein EROM_071070 [Encephalitozoon romaleae SJ-2008]
MKCIEEYTFDRDKCPGKMLEDILREDYSFDFEGEQKSLFTLRKKFLWYEGCKVIEVGEVPGHIHGNRLFMVEDRLRVYELPSVASRFRNASVAKKEKTVCIERDGRKCFLPDGAEDGFLDGDFSKDRVWIWSLAEEEGREYLSRKVYLLRKEELVGPEKKLYKRNGEVILQIQDIFVRKCVEISNPMRVWSKAMGDGMVVIVVTSGIVYMEYGGYVSSKPCCKGIYGMDGCRLLGLSSWTDISDLYLTLRLFTDIQVDLRALERIEEYLFKLFVFTSKGEWMVKWLLKSGMDKEKEMILCRLYRKVDDKGKRKLNPWMERIISLDALKLVIIYFPEEMERYIRMCIEEKREYEIEEIIEHYRGSEMIERICQILLRNNCLYLFSLCMPEYVGKFGDVALVEKYNMESQKNKWKVQKMEENLI